MHISDFVECMNTELYSCIFQILIFHLQVSCWSKVWINIKLLFIFHLYTFKFTGLEINKDSVSLKLFGWSLGTFSIISDLQQLKHKNKNKNHHKKKNINQNTVNSTQTEYGVLPPTWLKNSESKQSSQGSATPKGRASFEISATFMSIIIS